MQLCHNQEICEALELMSLSTFQSGQKLSSEHNIRIKNLYFLGEKSFVKVHYTTSIFLFIIRLPWLDTLDTLENKSTNITLLFSGQFDCLS